jgi:hypothetical protein
MEVVDPFLARGLIGAFLRTYVPASDGFAVGDQKE